MRCPFATWRGPVPNMTPRAMLEHRGLVLHVEQGSEAGTDSWFHNPAAKVSAHFGVGTDGALDQWVDTDDKAWAEAAGNPAWVSAEIAGYSGRPATAAQLVTLGHLWSWLAALYAWPALLAESPSDRGLGWHGMGGAAWGAHLDCPGDPIKRQRPQIIFPLDPTAPPPAPPAVPVSYFLLNGDPHVRVAVAIETDGNGNGFLPAPLANVDEAKMVAVTVQGSDPAPDADAGYWPGEGHWQDRGGHPLISITRALPNQPAVNVFVVYGQ